MIPWELLNKTLSNFILLLILFDIELSAMSFIKVTRIEIFLKKFLEHKFIVVIYSFVGLSIYDKLLM